MDVNFANIPESLKALPQWVLWNYETRDGKKTKVPYNARNGARAQSNNPATWVDFSTAESGHKSRKTDGIGFVLTAEIGIVGVDLDHCFNESTGEIAGWALDHVQRLNTYTEITPSNEGLRCFAFGSLPPEGRKRGDIEMYVSGRFLTITGKRISETPDIEERTQEILESHRVAFPPKEKPPEQANRPSGPIDLDDAELMRKACDSKNGYKIAQLLNGDYQSLYSSHSEADSALCYYLAWWTNRDAARVDRLFRLSGLYRPKWDAKHASNGSTYGQLTIERAIAGVGGGYDPFLQVECESADFSGKNEGSVGFVGNLQNISEIFEGMEFNPQPLPISTALLPVHRLVPEDIPSSLRGWQADIAYRMSVPLEYPMAGALVGLSSVIGRRLAIRPKQYDDWTVVPNLWGMAIGSPGQQKTPTSDESLRPLKRLEAEAAKAHEGALLKHQETIMVAKVKAKAAAAALEKAAKSKSTDAELRLLAQEAIEADGEMKEPGQKRFVVGDVTVEALAMVMKDNPNGVLCARDELSAFLKTLDKAGHEADRGFFLEAWNGNGSMTYDRIGRGLGIHIPSICVAVYGTIQPGVLARTVRGAASGEGADGLIQRFQIMMFPDAVPFKHTDRYPDSNSKNNAYKIYNYIANVSFEDLERIVGAQIDEYDTTRTPFIRFAPDAQEFFNEWWTDLEVTKIRGRESPMMEAHLSKYRSLMPSLALIFHLIEVVDGNASGAVSLSAARFAAGWCSILESHARRVYQMAFDGDPEPAIRLSERLKQSLPNPFTARQVVQKGWSGLTTTEEVERAVNVLEDRGWIKTIEVPPSKLGGRPSRQHFINPAIADLDAD